MFYKHIITATLVVFFFNGCVAKYFSLGEQETFQELNGKVYKNCGTNASFSNLLEDTDTYSKDAYKNCIIDKRSTIRNMFGDDVQEGED